MFFHLTNSLPLSLSLPHKVTSYLFFVCFSNCKFIAAKIPAI